MRKVSSGTWIALAALVTALAAVGISVWQGYETRRHNRLSVSPRLMFRHDDSLDSEINGIAVRNHGLGPAVINRFSIYVDRNPVGGKFRSGWPKALRRLGINEPWIQYTWVDTPVVWRQNQLEFLIGMTRENRNETRRAHLERAVERLGFAICYCSLYGDCKDATWGLLPSRIDACE